MKPKFKTFGLTHIALAVEDVHRSIDFYQKVFGTVTMYLKDGFAQVQTPGTNDIIVFEENKELADLLCFLINSKEAGGSSNHFGILKMR